MTHHHSNRKVAAFLLFIFFCLPVLSKNMESAAQAVKNMGAGWNIGNTLDANSPAPGAQNPTSVEAYETGWGQPVISRNLIRMFKKKGFGAIRVPVTWWPHMDKDTMVNKAWMDRVETVVRYVLNEGMYCILNVHHDTGESSSCWLRADTTHFNAMNARYVKLWQQIARRFQGYGQRLVFEGYNELLDRNSTWNFPPDASSYTAVNRLAQGFVNTVRATGGNNATRNLMVNTYAAAHGDDPANNNHVLSAFRLPHDTTKGHLIVSVHSYNPWNWDKDGGRWTEKCDKDLDEMFTRLDKYFLSRGIPVIIGEYGALNINATPQSQAEGVKYARALVSRAKRRGIAAFYWMGLSNGSDRTIPRWTLPQVADAIVNEVKK